MLKEIPKIRTGIKFLYHLEDYSIENASVSTSDQKSLGRMLKMAQTE